MNSEELANLVASVAFLQGDVGKFGQDGGSWDGSGYLLRALNTKTSVTTVVLNSSKSLAPAPLPGLRLLLHGMIFRTSSFPDAPGKSQ